MELEDNLAELFEKKDIYQNSYFNTARSSIKSCSSFHFLIPFKPG